MNQTQTEGPFTPTQSPDSAGDLDPLADDRRPLGDICAGCEELTQRVEQLERRLTQLDTSVAQVPLSTFHCYWVCVGFHAMVAFTTFSSEATLTFAYPFLLGACGTLAVCHALTTRPFMHKIGRTTLSILVVLSPMLLSGWMSDMATPTDLLAMVAVYFPFMALGGWLPAKLSVWTRGWRIIPPGGSQEFSQLKIRDLMIVTLGAAVVFGAFRLALGNVDIGDGSEWLAVMLYFSVPVITASLISVLLARALLTARSSISFLSLAGVLLFGVIFVTFAYALLLGITDDFDFGDLGDMVWYIFLITLIGAMSPIVTFVLMRSAGYRFAPGLDR